MTWYKKRSDAEAGYVAEQCGVLESLEVAGALNVASHEDVPKLLAFMQQLANNMDVVSVEIDARCPARTQC